ncbi:PA0069 family radical SAM protein [Comamonas piscis]|uniref:PA0069 family radical SAM protein n=1 Tax=Comamonas piscis TaxID=1562974 RepID=A0A7G5ENX3_9BURK|nr:PA0069 family radical SAM protein [Comamonas piscis]QMV75698.1 PA0069 family radical SAM protein [Comamonas piscis]WSO36308.1 PA0069 family radical SAM protein [Comamonas piscis]
MPRKGRGAVGAPRHRFASDVREWADDGWTPATAEAGDGVDADLGADEGAWWQHTAESLPTQVHEERARSAIQKNDSPDIFFDHSVNPYRGCEHGCIYCYARPYHSYLNLSPGLDFETQLFAKTNIAQVLKAEISRPRYQPASLNIGSATDCYQPIERDLGLTRQLIEVLGEAEHPYSLITKSSAVERDIDLIAAAARKNAAAVYITITSLDPQLTRLLEPRAAAPHRRLRTIRRLAEAGIPVGVSVAPHIPFLTEDMEEVLAAARDAGATTAFYTVLRLPWELNGVFQQWLQAHYPQRADRVMERVRDLHQISEEDRLRGKSYDSQSFSRMKGQGLWADLVRQRFRRACAQLGYGRERIKMDWQGFEAWRARQLMQPTRAGGAAQAPHPGQGSLF